MGRRNVGGFKTCFKVKNFESKTKKGKAKDISRMIPRLLAYALLQCKETGNIGCANLEGRVQDRQGRSIVLCMYVCVYACMCMYVCVYMYAHMYVIKVTLANKII